AKMLVSPVNLLCMDEPTNHLDMWSRDVLEEALQEYSGALVLITHDRHLIRSVANRIVEVVEGRVTSFEGDYDYYLSKRQPSEPDAAAPVDKTPSPPGVGPKSKEQKRAEAQARARTKTLRDRVRKIEEELEKVGAELGAIEKEFADPDFYATRDDVAEVTRRYESRKRRVEKLEAQWAEAVEVLESEATG
ncbi:MAG: ABC transporter ATP-binding protein, partial [Actinomycetota bacterium]|nr:ABC transporter ATP-binding protein [Actinomycetota bacterium]